MSNRPTAYELGQEYAKLEKAHAEAETASTQAIELTLAAEQAFKAGPSDKAWAMVVEAGRLAVAAMDKKNATQKELDTVKKQARKWYGVAL